MKMLFISLLQLFILNSFGQFKLLNHTSSSVDIVYYNDSTTTAYFTNPSFFLLQKKKEGKLVYFLRSDMFHCIGDTLYLYFTDTTLTSHNNSYNIIDSFHQTVGMTKIDSLAPKKILEFKIRFPKTINYSHLTIKYNFSFIRGDFFNSSGIPITEIHSM